VHPSNLDRPVLESGKPEEDALLIVGTGAMACLFAARLVAAGLRITLLGTWPAGLRALQEDGVRLTRDDGSEAIYPVVVTAEPTDCTGARHALVLVKSWQTERAARQLAECLSAEGLALTLQNGLGNREKLVDALGVQRVALGVTTMGATLLGPGRVRPGGEGMISAGEHPRLAPLVSLLHRGGFAVETVPEAESLLWSKLVINAAINPITALLRVPNGTLVQRPEAQALLAAAAREAASVAAAQGLHLTYPDPVAAAESVAHRTATNTSSMLQDVLRGAPTEIDAICGAIVAIAERHNIPVPVTHTLWLLIKALVQPEN